MTRILIVDDKEDNLYYLRTLLQAEGCEVDSARHGVQALELARRKAPDVVISDLLMPVMDGYSLMRQWKADAHLRDVPFVVYTATYTEPEDEQLALRLGADAFILKPTEPEEFLARLRAVRASASAAVPTPTQQPSGDEDGLLREYNESLIRKLEQKTMQLEANNRILKEDVAARELAERALRESEASFRLLTEAMPQLVWTTQPDGWNSFFNQRWVEYTGLSAAECAGQGWSRPFHPDDRARAELAWKRAIETGEIYSIEARLRRADGSYRWWLVRGLPLRSPTGSIVKWIGTCTDIDELKRAAAQLQQTEEQLRQAQKMEAVGRLAGGIAHDFNNLLNVILGYSTILLSELQPGAPMREELEEVRRAGERATELTRQLLAFSRQQVLQPKVLNLSSVVREMEKLLERLLGEDVECSLRPADVLDNVYADPGQIEQIVMNLAVNARDAMPHGGTLTIETANVEMDARSGASHPELVPGHYVMLAVSDTGTGIDAAIRERIFEPFFTTKEVGKGTGLGLSTVFGIVKQSHGHISVDSEPGVGTTFKVYLPRTDRMLDTARANTPMPVAPVGTATIVVVEDHEQLRTMTGAIRRRHGYHVLEAQNGEEALQLGASFANKIDLLLTDVVMPRMSGRGLADRMVALRPGMKVLYVSGYTEDAIVHHAVLDEGIEFVQKPVTPETLLCKIEEMLAAG